MLGHVLLGTLLIVIDNSLNKKTMLFIHFKFRTVFLHNIISGSRDYIFSQLIRCDKHTVDHRIVCNLCNLRMQFFIQFSSGLLIFRFIYVRKYPPQFCRIQWCTLSRSQNCHLSFQCSPKLLCLPDISVIQFKQYRQRTDQPGIQVICYIISTTGHGLYDSKQFKCS